MSKSNARKSAEKIERAKRAWTWCPCVIRPQDRLCNRRLIHKRHRREFKRLFKPILWQHQGASATFCSDPVRTSGHDVREQLGVASRALRLRKMGKAESSGKWSLLVRARALSPTRICLPLAALIRHSTSYSVRWTFLIAARPLPEPMHVPREDMHTERSQ